MDVARNGDMVRGICRAPEHHTPVEFVGTFNEGSGVVSADEAGVVRVGDQGVTDCGHHFVAIAGSGIADADGIGIVRVGDPIEVIEGGEGTVITGSAVVDSE